MRLRHWLALAAAIRFIAAWTHAHSNYPDEWHQTLELSNLLLNGFATYSREISLHLRNLSWPALLTIPLWLAHALSAESIHLRVFSCQLFAAAFDLGAVWGFWLTLSRFAGRYAPASSRTFFQLAMGTLLLTWFGVSDSISLSSEHLSTSVAWITLGLLARSNWLAAGFALVGIGAMRYPAFLLSSAIVGCVIYSALRSRDMKRLAPLGLGILVGVTVFGLADWIAYGRPWESLWMYAQYNVLSGLAAKDFGEQSIWTYAHYFTYRWAGLLLPLGLVVGPLSLVGCIYGLRRAEPIAWAAAVYGIGHLLVSHREERFMAPEISLGIWLAASAALRLEPKLRAKIKGVALVLVGASTLINLLLLLRALWGDTWIGPSTRFELPAHLAQNPDTCAVVSTELSSSALLPFKDSQTVPLPAMAYLKSPRGERSHNRAAEASLTWYEYKPTCAPGQSFLLQLGRLDTEWLEEGCSVLPSGVLKILPHSFWPWMAGRELAAGTWLRCPAAVLATFKNVTVEHPLSRGFGNLSKLPGADELELISTGLAAAPQPDCNLTCNRLSAQ